MDPLISGGDKVVPLVIKEVENKQMQRRRYAIGFLGNGSYREAIPVLSAILQDSKEKDYFRGDALVALYMIDKSLGRELAKPFKDEQTDLGEISRRVLADDPQLQKRRTYQDALFGRHG